MNQHLDADTRKQQIVDAAAAVFARKGFHQASINDIVQQSGLSKGGVYWHFKSKDEIITAVFDQFFRTEIEGIQEIVTALTPVASKLRRLALQLISDTAAELHAYHGVWLELYAVAAHEERFRQQITAYLAQFVALLEALIQQGIDGGEFRPVAARQVALAMVAQFEGILLLWAVDSEMVDMVALAETAVDLLLHGLQLAGD